jgi:hypothetical protein
MTLVPVLRYPSGAAVVSCGAVPTGAHAQLTAEGWWRIGSITLANRPLMLQYGPAGQAWGLLVTRDGRAYFVVWSSAGVNVAHSPARALRYTRWAHVAGTYDGAAVRVWLDGRDVTEVSRVKGGPVSTTSQAVRIGGYIGDVNVGFVGSSGWCRVSDNLRLPGTVPGPDVYPPVDAHTLAQWNANEGAGAVTANAVGVSAYNGQLSGAAWATSEAGDRQKAQAAGVGWWGRRAPQALGLGVGNHG